MLRSKPVSVRTDPRLLSDSGGWQVAEAVGAWSPVGWFFSAGRSVYGTLSGHVEDAAEFRRSQGYAGKKGLRAVQDARDVIREASLAKFKRAAVNAFADHFKGMSPGEIFWYTAAVLSVTVLTAGAGKAIAGARLFGGATRTLMTAAGAQEVTKYTAGGMIAGSSIAGTAEGAVQHALQAAFSSETDFSLREAAGQGSVGGLFGAAIGGGAWAVGVGGGGGLRGAMDAVRTETGLHVNTVWRRSRRVAIETGLGTNARAGNSTSRSARRN